MKAKARQWIGRLEALAPREQAMVVLGAPLLLLALAEVSVFDPARKVAAEATKLAEVQRNELNALRASLAAQPDAAPVPAMDQLQRQRDELKNELGTAQSLLVDIQKPSDWGAVVRASTSGAPGLSLTQLKTLPTEVVFSPTAAKPASTASAPARKGAASAPGANPVSEPAWGTTIYRHRVELSIKGNFDALLAYLKTLQRLPGDLRWDRLQLNVSGYPEAAAQLTLTTLSTRAETPFD